VNDEGKEVDELLQNVAILKLTTADPFLLEIKFSEVLPNI
jgi:hypothetical protein